MIVRAREHALSRMDELVEYWKSKQGVRAVIAFGSLAEVSRFDQWSDLDFLVICDSVNKQSLLESISALDKINSTAYYQIEYGDSVKVLFDDGILCDFGIVTEEQTFSFPHGQGRILWCVPDFPPDCAKCNYEEEMVDEPKDWIGDVLIHIYVGLLRQNRGEIAAAFEEIQIIAVKKLVAGIFNEKKFTQKDIFSPMRRVEKCKFEDNKTISNLMPGYSYNLEAAREIVKWLKNREYPLKLMTQVEHLLNQS